MFSTNEQSKVCTRERLLTPFNSFTNNLHNSFPSILGDGRCGSRRCKCGSTCSVILSCTFVEKPFSRRSLSDFSSMLDFT